jgi:hypothetical protein
MVPIAVSGASTVEGLSTLMIFSEESWTNSCSGTFTLNASTAQNGTLNFTAAFYGTNFEFPSSSLANGNITNATYVHTLFQLVDLVYDELTESAYEFS